MFRLTTEALARADYPLLFGLTVVGAAFVALASLAVDVALAWLDPRVRLA